MLGYSVRVAHAPAPLSKLGDTNSLKPCGLLCTRVLPCFHHAMFVRYSSSVHIESLQKKKKVTQMTAVGKPHGKQGFERGAAKCLKLWGGCPTSGLTCEQGK